MTAIDRLHVHVVIILGPDWSGFVRCRAHSECLAYTTVHINPCCFSVSSELMQDQNARKRSLRIDNGLSRA